MAGADEFHLRSFVLGKCNGSGMRELFSVGRCIVSHTLRLKHPCAELLQEVGVHYREPFFITEVNRD